MVKRFGTTIKLCVERTSSLNSRPSSQWTLCEHVPRLPHQLSALVKVRKRLETGVLEPTVEDHSTPHRQLVRLTQAQIDRLLEGYESGKTVYELGAQFGIHRTAASRYVKQRGVVMRRQGVDESYRGEILRLREQGWSFTRLGERFGVDPGTIRNFLLRTA